MLGRETAKRTYHERGGANGPGELSPRGGKSGGVSHGGRRTGRGPCNTTTE